MGVSQCQKNGKKSKREKEKALDEIAQAKKKKPYKAYCYVNVKEVVGRTREQHVLPYSPNLPPTPFFFHRIDRHEPLSC